MSEEKPYDPNKPTALGYAIWFFIVALVLIFVVAFVHDLVTGQLPDGNPCSQYDTYEAQEFCADNL